MKIIHDFHLHTNVTDDCEQTLAEVAEKAVQNGLAEICITNHYIIGARGFCVTPEEIEQLFIEAEEIMSRTGLAVRIGLEADYIPGREKQLEHFLASFDFDFVIGACHNIDGLGVALEETAMELFAKYDALTCYRKSLENYLPAAESGMFDSLAHLDIIRKYASGHFGAVPFDHYADLVDRIAGAMLASGTGFELNCRGYDHSCAEHYPTVAILELLRDRGVKTVTIGSDAHCPDHVGLYLDRGAEALNSLGFDSYTVFRKRLPYRIALLEHAAAS